MSTRGPGVPERSRQGTGLSPGKQGVLTVPQEVTPIWGGKKGLSALAQWSGRGSRGDTNTLWGPHRVATTLSALG